MSHHPQPHHKKATTTAPIEPILEKIRWNADGLITVIAQDWQTHEVLMLAWMNEEALIKTVKKGEAVYWSRSRKKLWHKGEESGHVQKVRDIFLDCDGDALLIKVEQAGLACHTGRRHCFFHRLESKDGEVLGWRISDPVVSDPKDIYNKAKPSHE